MLRGRHGAGEKHAVVRLSACPWRLPQSHATRSPGRTSKSSAGPAPCALSQVGVVDRNALRPRAGSHPIGKRRRAGGGSIVSGTHHQSRAKTPLVRPEWLPGSGPVGHVRRRRGRAAAPSPSRRRSSVHRDASLCRRRGSAVHDRDRSHTGGTCAQGWPNWPMGIPWPTTSRAPLRAEAVHSRARRLLQTRRRAYRERADADAGRRHRASSITSTSGRRQRRAWDRC
jgi:hypothetical protein